jgi:thioredoxin reductase
MTSDDETAYDITIIGAGPTGMFGAFYAGLRQMKTLLIEALPQPGGQLAVLYPEKFIYDVAGYPSILAKDLVKELWQQAAKFNPDVRFDEQVVHLKQGEHDSLVVTTDKATYRSRTVLIAAGIGAFAPNRLDRPGLAEFEGRGVHYFVENADLFMGKQLLIVGGGDSAVDWALSLKDRAQRVTLVHRRADFRAHERSVAELMTAEAVEKRLWWEVKEAHGNGHIQTVTIVNNQTGEEATVEADAMLLNLGFKADLGRIKEWGLEFNKRAIVVDGLMATNLPGVYAAGDIADPKGSVALTLIATGFAQAVLAVNCAKNYMDPKARVFPGHSSEKRL